MMGWRPADLAHASLAEMLAAFDGHAAAQGWHAAEPERPEPMTRARLLELMETYPDGR